MNLEICNYTNNELIIWNIQWNAQYNELLNNHYLLMLNWFPVKAWCDREGTLTVIWEGKGKTL